MDARQQDIVSKYVKALNEELVKLRMVVILYARHTDVCESKSGAACSCGYANKMKELTP